MDSLSFVGLFFVIFLSFLSSTQGRKFYVGGKEGWVLEPSESYDHWARKNRFQINDTIVFKYKKGSDSVLVVHDIDDYSKCNKTKPIHHLKDGHSKLKFTRNGPFYFISGKDDNCEKGQKVLVVVMSPNHRRRKSPSPASSPVTTPTPPTEPAPPTVTPTPGSIAPAPAPAPSAASVDVSGSNVLFGFFISLIAAAIFL